VFIAGNLRWHIKNSNGVMHMTGLNRLLAATLLAAVSVVAHADETTYVFDSVSKIGLRPTISSFIYITGTLVNETAPTTLEAPSSDARCEGFYNSMLESPGKYSLSITIVLVPANPPLPASLRLTGCSLELKP
jgi:hypothetical protein